MIRTAAIGRIQHGGDLIEITAMLGPAASMVWLERAEPDPRLVLGYVSELGTASPRLYQYWWSWTPEEQRDIRDLAAKSWNRAVRQRLVRPRPSRDNLLPLGEAAIGGQLVDFEWSYAMQGVGVVFRYLEPKYIGHVRPDRDAVLRFAPGNLHRQWAEMPDHRQALVTVGGELYERRKKLLGFDPLKRGGPPRDGGRSRGSTEEG